jgi:superfamily II DNA or RNA helicase
LLASYPVFQAGINIPNLRYVMFASSYKSMVRIGQSIGRSLRTKEGKEDSCIVDLIDHSNKYLPKQSKERISYYNREGFDIKEFVYKEKEYGR